MCNNLPIRCSSIGLLSIKNKANSSCVPLAISKQWFLSTATGVIESWIRDSIESIDNSEPASIQMITPLTMRSHKKHPCVMTAPSAWNRSELASHIAFIEEPYKFELPILFFFFFFVDHRLQFDTHHKSCILIPRSCSSSSSSCRSLPLPSGARSPNSLNGRHFLGLSARIITASLLPPFWSAALRAVSTSARPRTVALHVFCSALTFPFLFFSFFLRHFFFPCQMQ